MSWIRASNCWPLTRADRIVSCWVAMKSGYSISSNPISYFALPNTELGLHFHRSQFTVVQRLIRIMRVGDGVIVSDVACPWWIRALQVLSSNPSFTSFSHWRRDSNVLRLRIQLWITYSGDCSECCFANSVNSTISLQGVYRLQIHIETPNVCRVH